MSEYVINLAYDAAKKDVEQLKDIADELDKESRALSNMMENLNASWKGGAATGYVEKCQWLKDELDGNIKHIRSIANAISKTADTYKKMELEKETDQNK